jgi:uncharacterized protein YndB with AHSA1/START domain
MIQDLTKLQLVLDGETDVVIRRDFTHPPARVWRALTEPALIRQWMAARDTMTRCEMDLRPGGRFTTNGLSSFSQDRSSRSMPRIAWFTSSISTATPHQVQRSRLI